VKGSFNVTFDPAEKNIISGTTITGSTNLAKANYQLYFEHDPTQNGGSLSMCGGGCGVGGTFTLNVQNFVSVPAFWALYLLATGVS
jgi:hypothetical protein